MTVFEALVASIAKAADYNSGAEVPPMAILWPDEQRQWQSLLPRLRRELPLLTYGDYDPSTKTGPAIWLRCMVDRTLTEADWPEDQLPVVYLPGVSYLALRQPADLPDALKPLAELQYRGVVWRHPNNRDWSVAAFLRSDHGGLGLDLAGDQATQQAMLGALARLADEPVEKLRQHGQLNAAFFNDLLNPDLERTLLGWLNDQDGTRQALGDEAWQAFCATCRSKLSFDPETDGALTGAQRLGGREGAWELVWQRFTEAPRHYPSLPELLDRARPPRQSGVLPMFEDLSSWPVDNREAEDELRGRLSALVGAERSKVVKALPDAELHHGERREWAWAALDQAPLALALVPLLDLAEATERPLGGDRDSIAIAYAASGWRADAALLDCLASVSGVGNIQAVWGLADTLYQPWLCASVEAFQNATANLPPAPIEDLAVEHGSCVVFVDGLRLDVGQRLGELLRETGNEVTVDYGLAAFPTVTATAKPAVSPVASQLTGGEGLGVVSAAGGAVQAAQLRKLIADAGFTILEGDEVGDGQGRAWTETGDIDKLGHNHGTKLAEYLPRELERIAERIQCLLAAGWAQVLIVTDHGWLLTPYDLPKEELPEHLTAVRKGRCARLAPGQTFHGKTMSWSWNPSEQIAVASGTACFVGNVCYEHGGLSPQECVTPRITIRPTEALVRVTIESVTWRGLRCQVETTGGAGMLVDVRTKPTDENSSVAFAAKPCDAQGVASIPCNDSAEGQAAVVVVLGPSGEPVAQRSTLVGGES